MASFQSILIALYAGIAWTVGEWSWDVSRGTMLIAAKLQSYSEHENYLAAIAKIEKTGG